MNLFGKNRKKKYNQDRRLFKRIPVKLLFMFHKKGKEQRENGEILDISANGIGFITRAKLSPNTPLKMWLNMPQCEESLYVTGNVIWCRRLGTFSRLWRAGIQLEKADLIGLGKILAQ